MATGSCFSSLFHCSDLNKQICTVGVKTKAFIFAVSDRRVLSSEVSNFQAAFHDVWDVSVLVALTPGGGYSWEFLLGCAAARFSNFPHPFSDQISKIRTHLRPGL